MLENTDSIEEINEFAKQMTYNSLDNELDKILANYMIIYDEYHNSNRSNDSAFLHDLVDSLQGISAVLEVYVRDRYIHPNYAIEKLENSRSYINACIDFYKSKDEYVNKEE